MNRAVIFDKDGVIVDTKQVNYEAYRRVLSSHNISLDEKTYSKHSGRSAVDFLSQFIHTDILKEKLRHILHQKDIHYFEIFKSHVQLIPGVIEFLEQLKKNKIKIGLATSSRKIVLDHTFSQFPIAHYFDAVVTCDEVEHAKPAPDVYLRCAKKLGVDPSRCLVFEDSHSGVVSAKKAGMKVILVMTSFTHEEIPEADDAIRDFNDPKAGKIVKK